MGLDELRRHLKTQARDETERILAEARERADTIRKDSIEKARQDAKTFEDGVLEAERKARGTVIQARAGASRGVSQAYEEVLEMVIDGTLERLAGLDGKVSREFLERGLDVGARLLGEFTVSVCNEADGRTVASMGHTVSGTVDGAGGILLATDDGRVLDLRLDTIVEEMRPRIREMVVRELEDGDDA